MQIEPKRSSISRIPNDAELSLDELDAVAGGAGGSDLIEAKGQIIADLQNFTYTVQIEDGREGRCHLSDALRMESVRPSVGDMVKIRYNPSIPSSNTIVYLYR